jgi:hypothetical protein
MSETFARSPRVLILFALVAVLLTGCPKSPSPGAGMAPGSSAGGAAGSASGSGGTGTGSGAGSGLQAGGSGAQGGQGSAGMAGATSGSARATGTNIPALPSPTEFSATSALRDIHFAFDKYDVSASDKTVLDANARWLKSHAKALVLIEGHCDERGRTSTTSRSVSDGPRRPGTTWRPPACPTPASRS